MTHPNPYKAPESPLLRRMPDERRERTVMAWGVRFLIVGGVLGFLLSIFVLPSTLEAIPFVTVSGALIGTAIGAPAACSSVGPSDG